MATPPLSPVPSPLLSSLLYVDDSDLFILADSPSDSPTSHPEVAMVYSALARGALCHWGFLGSRQMLLEFASFSLEKWQMAAPHSGLLSGRPLHAGFPRPANLSPMLQTYGSFQGCGHIPGPFWLHAPPVQPPVPAGQFHCHCFCCWPSSPEHSLAWPYDHAMAFHQLFPPSHLLL